MGMQRFADRDSVWKALVECDGVRDRAAAALGVSLRTLNRYLTQYNLLEDMDKAGFNKRKGPPRLSERDRPMREDVIKAAIRKHEGQLDYGELAVELYGEDNDVTRQRVYSALNDLRLKGVIMNDGKRWFILLTDS